MSDLFIEGPAGKLEAKFSELSDDSGVILCHPHPQMGGSMEDMVLAAVEQAFTQCRASVLRFNFRGVGQSEGSYDDGRGEVEDVIAAYRWLASNKQGAPMLAGYSFGAAMALAAAPTIQPEQLILVAPPVTMLAGLEPPLVPTLVVLGTEDQFVPFDSSRAWFEDSPATVVALESDHFFGGGHEALTALLVEHLSG